MTHLLRFDDLQAIFHHSIAHLPDHRKPSPNTRYTIQDAVLGAFGIFFTQSPSFLEYQRRLQQTKGRNNAQTLLGVAQIPCDNQVRTLLDSIGIPILRLALRPGDTRARWGREGSMVWAANGVDTVG